MIKNINISRNIANGVFGNTNSKFLKRDKWSPNEIKLFLNLVFKLQEAKSLNLNLAPRDFYSALSNNNRFDYLNKILTGIKSKNFFMKVNDTYRNYSLFSYLEYNNAGDSIGVQFNKDLKEQIFDLKSFSRIDLDELMKLDSYFAIRSRLLLSAFDNRKDFIMDIDRFKTIFQVPDSYKNANIEKKVFAMIKKECPEIIDVYFKKSGRKATHVIFNYDFKKLKSKTKVEKTKVPEEIKTAIEKAKRNKFIQEAWTVKTDKKIGELLKNQGEITTKKVLSTAYKSLSTPIISTLEAYLNKVLNGFDEEMEVEPKVETPTEPSEKPQEATEDQDSTIETPELLEEAKKLYTEEIGVLKLSGIQEEAFNFAKKQFLVKAAKNKKRRS